MDPMMGSSGSSCNDQEASNSRNGKKSSSHRHTTHQTHMLEASFKQCPHPDDNQRQQLSKELGLEPRQIKFWFQNKRTQTKSQNERAGNFALRAENERIRCENFAIMEALKNVICPSCGGPPLGEEERQKCLQKLKLENARLKEEHENVSNLLAKYTGKAIQKAELLASNFMTQKMESPTLYNYLNPETCDNISLPYQFNGVTDKEKALMSETAASAMDELIKLLQVNEPLWAKSPSDGRYVIEHNNYQKLFSRATHLRSTSARIESSKDSALVTMNATELVYMFLDADKWVDLFPTIVTKGKTIQLLETEMDGNKNGSLQLMYEQMHILSPFVAPREFYLLRRCKQLETGIWVLVDVSYPFFKETFHSWKLPSGCMIQEMPNGCSMVTWVEHVEVDDKLRTHRLYKDLICSSSAYGADRWVTTLQMMCERLSVSNGEIEHIHLDLGKVISLLDGKRSIMNLAHRMVKSFCSILNASGELDFPQLSEENNSGVRVSVRHNIEPSHPIGMIISASTSLWLPLPCQTVFSLLKDEKLRVQWDVLFRGDPINEIVSISTGNLPGNCISIIKPYIPVENNILMLQEMNCTKSLGAMVVYAPISVPTIDGVINGEDFSNMPILPSGFIVSGDGHSEVRVGANSTKSSGSLLTIALQILASSPPSSMELSMQSVATVNTLISSTTQRIKTILNNFD